MKKENPVLVLASGYDPQFAMLNELPHTVCEEVAACTQAGKDATVILLWSGTRELLRSFDPILEGFRKNSAGPATDSGLLGRSATTCDALLL